MVDVTGPLTQVLEEAHQGQLTLEGAIDVVETALKLLGNASARTSHVQCQKVLEQFIISIQPLAEKDE